MILSLYPNLSSAPHLSNQTPSKFTQNHHRCLANSSLSVSPRHKRRCDFHDLHDELVPYVEAWRWQNSIVETKKALSEKNEDLAESLIILQHQPVYTLGAGSSDEFLKFDVKNAPFDLYRTERGGEVTYHGPGQLVMYPIMNLRYHKMDLHWYLRALEEVVIRAISSAFAIEASRIDGLTGVWVGNQKLAAIGIKISRWITYHGLALNVTTDLTPFQRIVPCGIPDRQVGSIKGLLNARFRSKGYEEDGNQIDDHELIHITYTSLITQFCEVFQVDLGNNIQIKELF